MSLITHFIKFVASMRQKTTMAPEKNCLAAAIGQNGEFLIFFVQSKTV